jgi:hypothetical protein
MIACARAKNGAIFKYAKTASRQARASAVDHATPV